MKDKFLTSNVQTFTLSNGLKVSLIPKNTYVYYGQLDIPLGSYHLNYQLNDQKYTLIPGVAHFLEHQAFLDETGDSFKTLSSLGIYTNALTSYRQTSYLIHGKDHFFDGLAILLKAIDTPYFIDQAIENEKKIIQEEIKMYQDETDYQIQNKLYQNMLFKHPLQHDILGNIDDIDCITKDDLYRAYHHFYLSAKKHLILAGPFEIKGVISFLEGLKLKTISKEIPMILPNHEPSDVKIKEDTLYVETSLPQLSLGIKYHIESKDELLLFKTEISMLFLIQLLCGSISDYSAFLMKEGLISSPFEFQVTMEDETLIFIIENQTKDPRTLNKHLVDLLLKKEDQLIDEGRFLSLKKGYMGQFILSLDEIEHSIFLYGKYALNDLKFEDVIHILNALTVEDLKTMYHALSRAMISSLFIYPKTSI